MQTRESTRGALCSIPLVFPLGFLGTITDRKTEDAGKQSEMEVRSLTGLGAEGASSH